MPDTDRSRGCSQLNTHAPKRLDEALRALPQYAPQTSAWPDIAARLRCATVDAAACASPRSPRRMRAAATLGIAAVLMLAVCAAMLIRQPSLTKPADSASANHDATQTPLRASSVHDVAKTSHAHVLFAPPPATLAAAQARSRALERWLRETRAGAAPQSAPDLAASTEIEDMIGLIDIQLDASDASDATVTLPLWQRRVALLEDLSTLRYGANALNVRNGVADNGAPMDSMRASSAF